MCDTAFPFLLAPTACGAFPLVRSTPSLGVCDTLGIPRSTPLPGLFLARGIGPVEGLLMIIAAYLGTYWTGPGLWTSAFNDVSGLQWELTAGVPFGEALAGGMAIGVVITMISSAVKVAAASKEQGEGIDGQVCYLLLA